jgi:hypothetical protein
MSTKKKEIKRVTNKMFAKEDGFFQKACEKADVKVTTRQASKFRMNKGLAFKHRKQVKEDN